MTEIVAGWSGGGLGGSAGAATLVVDEDAAAGELARRTPGLGALLGLAVDTLEAGARGRAEGVVVIPRGGVWREREGTSREGRTICKACLAGALIPLLGVAPEETVEQVLERAAYERRCRELASGSGGPWSPLRAGEVTAGSAVARLNALEDLRWGDVEHAAQRLYGSGAGERTAHAMEGELGARAREGALHRTLRAWDQARRAYRRLAHALEHAGL